NVTPPIKSEQGQHRFFPEHPGEVQESVVAIPTARPELNAPCATPASTAEAAPLQNESSRIPTLPTSGHDDRARRESPHRRDVPMIIIRHVHVLNPFLKLAVFPNLIWWKLIPRFLQFGGESLVCFQNTGGRNRAVHQSANKLIVHRRTVTKRALFRRK